jgi:hypothetical protein
MRRQGEGVRPVFWLAAAIAAGATVVLAITTIFTG